jgi:NAD(P)-dependent dehydrogenase (short-subunit alcohol dehydrogenase family)
LGEHGLVFAQCCDVADPKQVKSSIGQVVKHFRRIDALVNNAGIAVFKPILKTTYKEWARVLDVNLSGPFICTQACASPTARARPGSTT